MTPQTQTAASRSNRAGSSIEPRPIREGVATRHERSPIEVLLDGLTARNR